MAGKSAVAREVVLPSPEVLPTIHASG
jgi:hypothetical protein